MLINGSSIRQIFQRLILSDKVDVVFPPMYSILIIHSRELLSLCCQWRGYNKVMVWLEMAGQCLTYYRSRVRFALPHREECRMVTTISDMHVPCKVLISLTVMKFNGSSVCSSSSNSIILHWQITRCHCVVLGKLIQGTFPVTFAFQWFRKCDQYRDR